MTLLSVHGILAGMMQQPALNITPKEASEMTKAIANVQAQYPMTVDPKLQAWFSLGMVAAAIYIPRVFVMRATAKKPGPAQEQQQRPRSRDDDPAPRGAPNANPEKRGPMTPSDLYGPGYRG